MTVRTKKAVSFTSSSSEKWLNFVCVCVCVRERDDFDACGRVVSVF